MRVVEARHDEVSAEIDDLRCAALQLADVVVRSYGNDATIAHRHRLCARRSRLGVDVAVEEDYVGAGVSLAGAERLFITIITKIARATITAVMPYA